MSTFKYDALKRASEMFYVSFSLDREVEWSRRLRYFYQGTDTLPYLVTRQQRYYRDIGWNSDDSLFLNYANGLVSRDSARMYIENATKNPYTATHTNTPIGGVLYHHLIVRNTDSDGQLNLSQDNTYPITVNRVDGNVLGFTALEGPEHEYNENRFNNHPDPLFRFYPTFPFDYQLAEWGEVAYRNLRTHAAVNSSPLSASPDEWDGEWFLYDYRADGYPLVMQVKNNWDDEYNMHYVYY